MQKAGRVDICFNSQVNEIQPKFIRVLQRGKDVQLKNDFLFVFAGAEMPHEFLMGLGIEIDKKFGESLKKVQTS